jgi:drug/metabolite transporter (DMT)-like permease
MASSSASTGGNYAAGVLAAVGNPFFMTIGFFIWDKQWLGSAFALNMYKCSVASVGFVIAAISTRAAIMNTSMEDLADIFTQTKVGFLVLSSTIGILIGDWAWLEGLHRIGAKRIIIIDTLKPFLAALLGWVVLGEGLNPIAGVGLLITAVGVLVVNLEQQSEQKNEDEEDIDGAGCQGGIRSKGADDVNQVGAKLQSNAGEEALDSSFALDRSAAEENVKKIKNLVTSRANGDEEKSCKNKGEPSLGSESQSINNTNVEDDDVNALVNDTGAGPTTSKPYDKRETHKRRSTLQRRSMTSKDIRLGYFLAVCNVALDTYGSLLTKQYGVGMTTWEINLIRFGFAAVCLVLLSAAMRIVNRIRLYIRSADSGGSPTEGKEESSDYLQWYHLPPMSRKRWLLVSAGVGFVTFLCPALSNYALFQMALALALALGSVGPLYSIPLSWFVHKERPTIRGSGGASAAVSGIVVLSFWGQSSG